MHLFFSNALKSFITPNTCYLLAHSLRASDASQMQLMLTNPPSPPPFFPFKTKPSITFKVIYGELECYWDNGDMHLCPSCIAKKSHQLADCAMNRLEQ